MRILCIHQGFELFGSDRSFLLSLGFLKSQFPDASFTVIIPKEGPLISELKKIVTDVRVEDIGAISRNDLKRPVRTLFRILSCFFQAIKRSRRYDFIYINTVVIVSYILAQRFVNSTSLIHVREIPTGVQKVFFSSVLRFSGAHVIYNSMNTRNAFLFRNHNKERIILNAVNPIVSEMIAFRPTVNILLIGRISEWKGQRFFINGIGKLEGEYLEKIKVKIVGSAPAGRNYLIDEIKSDISNLGLDNIVELCPFSNNPQEFFNWSTIVVVPSTKPEPFGRVAIEAMSAGRSVIAAKHGGLLEIVKDGETGWFFEAGNEESLRTIIRKVVKLTAEEWQTFHMRTKEEYLRRFTTERYRKEFFKFVYEVMGKMV